MSWCRSLFGLLFLVAASPATANEPPCYDLKVRAKVVDVLPTLIPPEKAKGGIFISWPWFVDLKVTRVLEGEGSKGLYPVLAVLHGGLGPEKRVYFLRSNTIGGYNLIRTSDENALERCQPGVAPAEPLMWDLTDKTIEEYRREAEEKRERYLEVDEDSQ